MIQGTGLAALAISLYYLADRLLINRHVLSTFRIGPALVIRLFIEATLYGLTFFLLSDAWSRLLRIFGEKLADRLVCHYIYSRTQIAKYIPGNVFQFAGRHALANGMGFRHGPLLVAMFLEAAMLFAAAATIVVLGITIFQLSTETHGCAEGICIDSAIAFRTITILLLITPVAVLVLISIRRIPRFRNLHYMDGVRMSELLVKLIPVYLRCLLFYILAGGVLLDIIYENRGTLNSEILVVTVTAFSLSWIVGFITPGSPAGVGVREAALVATLSPFIGEPTGLYAAFVLRIITVMGDLIFFLLSFPLKKRIKNRMPGESSRYS